MKVAVNFHPLLFPRKNNEEQISLLSLITDISKKNIAITLFNLAESIIEMIDVFLGVKETMDTIEKDYDSSVFYAFQSIVHCIRLSFLSFLCFTPFIAISVMNNFGFECRTTILCYGYMSFHRQPENLIYYFILSVLLFLTIGLIYNLLIVVKFYMRKKTIHYIRNDFPASILLFTTVTLKIRSKDDIAKLHNFTKSKIYEVDKHLIV